jgi:hypothetical protein
MKRAIGELVHHPKVLDKFGAAARQKVLADLTWDAKAQQVLSIYRAVLAGDDKLSSVGLPMPSSGSLPHRADSSVHGQRLF